MVSAKKYFRRELLETLLFPIILFGLLWLSVKTGIIEAFTKELVVFTIISTIASIVVFYITYKGIMRGRK